MYILGVNYEYNVNILREYNNSTSIKRSGGETKRSIATVQRFCRLLKRFPKRTQNEHCRTRTNRKRKTQTAYLRSLNCFVRLFGEDRDTPLYLCSHLRHAALYGVFGKQLGNLSAQTRRAQIDSQCTS